MYVHTEEEIDGTEVEITLAKPIDKDTLLLHRQARRNRTYLPPSILLQYMAMDIPSTQIPRMYASIMHIYILYAYSVNEKKTD